MLLIRQSFFYALIGGLSFIVDFLFYYALTRFLGIYFLLANVSSFLFAGTLNFLANRRFTFGFRGHFELGQYSKFFFVATAGVVLNTAILAALVRVFGVYDLLAKLLATAVVFFWNFGMNRHWTFRSSR